MHGSRSLSPARPDLAIALGSIFTHAVGAILYGVPKGPDESFTLISYAGTALLFISYFLAQAGWGRVIQLALRRGDEWWEAIFFGTLLLPLILATVSFFPWVGAGSAPAWRVFLLLGPAMLPFLSAPSAAKRTLHLSWMAIPLALTLGLMLLSSLTPHPFWDSLWYHLTGTRLWFEHSSVYLPEFFPIAFLSGLWDYHFLFAQILLGAPDGGGLLAAHLFGQWVSVSAVFSCFITLASLPIFRSASLAIAMAAIAGVELAGIAPFAKNDWGAAFWGLAFLSFLLRGDRAWLIGLAAGACFSAKFTTAFFLAPLLALWLWENRRRPRGLGALSSGMALGSLPVLIRNQIFTGNAFFPALNELLSSSMLGPSWNNISDYNGFTRSGSAVFSKLAELFTGSPAAIGLLLLPLAWKALAKNERALAAATLVSATAILFLTGEKAEWRLAGPTLLLLGAFGWLGIRQILRAVPEPSRGPMEAACLALLLVVSPVDWRAPSRLLPWRDPSLMIREYASGSSLAWIRLNAQTDSLAATLNEQRIYYFLPRPPIRAFDWPELDRDLSIAADPEQAVQAFHRRNIRYLVLSKEFLDRYFNQRVCEWMYELSESNPQAVAYRAEFSRVLDLSLLSQGSLTH